MGCIFSKFVIGISKQKTKNNNSSLIVRDFPVTFCPVLSIKYQKSLILRYSLSLYFFLFSTSPPRLRPFLFFLIWNIKDDGLHEDINLPNSHPLPCTLTRFSVSLVKTPCPLPPPHCSVSRLKVGCSQQHSWVCALRWARILHPEWGASCYYLALPRFNKRERKQMESP